MYQTEHDELFASIRNGKPINNGEYMARSTLLAIMGRMAAYTGQEITWEMAMNSKEVARPVPIRLGRPASGRRDRRAGPDAVPLRLVFRWHRGELRHDIGFNAAAVPGGDRGGGRHGRPWR